MSTPPRIFCITARSAPVVAVLRRGPSRWYHVGRWDVSQWTYEAGAWFRGRLFPQKCDLSPDGRWFAYSAHKPTARWEAGTIYEVISRLPWLHALAAWEAGTTYTRGIRFDDEAGTSEIGTPDAGDATPCLARFHLRDGARYGLVREDGTAALDGLQWADWSSAGELLSATTDGHVQAHAVNGAQLRPIFDHDLNGYHPDPVAPPPWALDW